MTFFKSHAKYILTLFLISILVLVSLISFLIFNPQSKASRKLKITYSNLALDNKENYLSCDELPSIKEVEEVFAKNKDLISHIESIYSDFTRVSIEKDEAIEIGNDVWKCPGKADLLIVCNGREDKTEIINKLGEDFKGIPYRVVDR